MPLTSFSALCIKVVETGKRCSTPSPDLAPPYKSPRIDDQFPTTQTSAVVEQPTETDRSEVQVDNTDGFSDATVNPTTRRKSFRRATVTRRSLPALQNQYQSETSVAVTPLESAHRRQYIHCFALSFIAMQFCAGA